MIVGESFVRGAGLDEEDEGLVFRDRPNREGERSCSDVDAVNVREEKVLGVVSQRRPVEADQVVPVAMSLPDEVVGEHGVEVGGAVALRELDEVVVVVRPEREAEENRYG